VRRGTTVLDMAVAALVLSILVAAFVPQMVTQRKLHRLAQERLRVRGVLASYAREVLLDPTRARLATLEHGSRLVHGVHVSVRVGPPTALPNALVVRQVVVTGHWLSPEESVQQDSVAVVVGE
jgi:hypothetical protein